MAGEIHPSFYEPPKRLNGPLDDAVVEEIRSLIKQLGPGDSLTVERGRPEDPHRYRVTMSLRKGDNA